MPVEFDAYDADGSGFRLTDGTDAYDVLQFLADHPETGFSPEEISEATDLSTESVRITLASLEARDLVRHKEPYWAIGDDDRLAAYQGGVQGLEAIENRHGDDSWDGWEETAVEPRDLDE